MKTTNHTPGTWEAKDQWGYIKVHSADNGVCVIHGLDSKANANAHLIASAPDLLSALESAYNAIAWDIPGENLSDQDEEGLLDVIRAAIAKAKGEA
jgi:hypothetical protein